MQNSFIAVYGSTFGDIFIEYSDFSCEVVVILLSILNTLDLFPNDQIDELAIGILQQTH